MHGTIIELMMKMSGRIFLLLAGLCAALATSAQNDDSTLYRNNKVKTVIVGVMIPVLVSNDDTCMFRVSYINRRGLADSIVEDQNCMGWDRRAEYHFRYDSMNNMTQMDILANDAMESRLLLEYDSAGRISSEAFTYFEPYQETNHTRNIYYGPPARPDSVYYITISAKDTTVIRKRNRYNPEGKLIRVEEFPDTADKMLSMTVYKYDTRNRLIRYEYTNFERYDADQVTTYTYDENERIFRTEDQLYNSAAEFYYYKNGLLGKAFYYNRFGQTEREELYLYQFYGE